MKLVILCGGIGSRMNDYSLPKPLNMIHGKHAISYVLSDLPDDIQDLYFIYGSHLKHYNFEEIIINTFKNRVCHFNCIDYFTRGAIETAFVGTQSFENANETIVFIDNDNLYKFPSNFPSIKDKAFLGCSVDTTNKSSYSFVLRSNDIITDIAEKRRISDTYCCGVYGFENIMQFRKYASKLLFDEVVSANNGELYMSNIYKLMLNDNIDVHYIEFINQGNHIGSLDELKTSLQRIPLRKMRICFDLDNTLVTYPCISGDYTTVKPINNTISLLNRLYSEGHTIIIYTARRMQTHNSNIGAVMKDIGRITFDTLDNFNIQYHEIVFGKPIADIYIDDRSVNPTKDDYAYMGLFQTDTLNNEIINKLPNNKYNSIELQGNNIVKSGPLNTIRGEYTSYEILKDTNIQQFFPKMHSFTNNDSTGYLELEYIKGIPFYYLYKNKLLQPVHIRKLIDILHTIHEVRSIPLNVTIQDVKNNYIKKLEDRFKDISHYPFTDSADIFKIILDRLKLYTNSNRISITPFIHGDFWFSNIMYTFDNEIKCFDMRGKIYDKYTTNGDRLYDYAKLYQSLLGYDSILYSNTRYINPELIYLFESEVENIGIDLKDIKIVTISLIAGSLHSIESLDTRKRVWEFIKTLLSY
jgi:capsule biosynthesis phosphatase